MIMDYSVRILNPNLQHGEVNICVFGHGSFEIGQVSKSWKCPSCGHYLSIRAEIEGFEHAVHRVPVAEITSGDLIALDERRIWEIIDARKNEDGLSYRLAIKNYRVIIAATSSTITKIIGSWKGQENRIGTKKNGAGI